MGLWSFWLILGVGFLIAELLTMSMTCIYVGIGALAAMACALLGGEWISSIIVFVASTAIIYFATYRWRHKITKALHSGASHSATGMDALIGRTGTVIEAPDGLRMRIDGDVWKVSHTRHESELKPGDNVRVVGYDSIILSVEPIQHS